MWPEDSLLKYSQYSMGGMPEIHYCTDTSSVADCSGYSTSFSKNYVLPKVDWDKILGRTSMKEKTPETKETKEKKIYLERSDSYDRAIVDGSRLEPLDVFRIVDDEFRKAYLVIDTSEVIDADTVDDDTIYALDLVAAKVVAFSKDIKVYVYDPDCVRIKIGDFVKDYGKKEINA